MNTMRIGWMVWTALAVAIAAVAGGLPAGYEQLEYIEGNGKEWIDSGYAVTGTDRVEMKVRFNSIAEHQCLFCARGFGNNENTFSCFLVDDDLVRTNALGRVRFDRNRQNFGPYSDPVAQGKVVTIVADGAKRVGTVDGKSAGGALAEGEFTPGGRLTLFGSHNDGKWLNPKSAITNFGTYRLYSCKVFNAGGTLQREFVPARNVNGKAGLYETQLRQFHPFLPHLKAQVKMPKDFQAGVNFGFYAGNGYFGSALARDHVDAMAKANVKWVCVIVTVWQDTWCSTRQYRDWENTPNDLELKEIIDYIHSKGMKVTLRPMEEATDGSDRGFIRFPHVTGRMPGKVTTHKDEWFRSMAGRSRYYAEIAQRTKCEAYCLDSEINNLSQYGEEWKMVVRAVRSVYDGPVTCCFSFGSEAIKDHYLQGWYQELDYLCFSCYPCPMGRGYQGGASMAEMQKGFEKQVPRFRRVAEVFGKPVVFGEVGCTSNTGAAARPAAWWGKTYDGEEQANYIEAFYRAFSKEKWFRGMYWWKWDENVDRPVFRDDPAGDKGFTVRGKPAEAVMRRIYGEAK